MRAAAFFTLQEVGGGVLEDHVCVVIDVLRASSTIVAALGAGAQAIYPVESTERALELAGSLGRQEALLAGERGGLRIEGFDLGNSPREFIPERVAGKKIVMTTTNGTRALSAAAGADRVLIGALANLSAVADALADAPRVAIVCSGRAGRFALDDALCAGMLLARLAGRAERLELDDAGRAALALAGAFGSDAAFLGGTAAGRALAEIGLAEDVDWCARVDTHDRVPELVDQVIRGDGQA